MRSWATGASKGWYPRLSLHLMGASPAPTWPPGMRTKKESKLFMCNRSPGATTRTGNRRARPCAGNHCAIGCLRGQKSTTTGAPRRQWSQATVSFHVSFYVDRRQWRFEGALQRSIGGHVRRNSRAPFPLHAASLTMFPFHGSMRNRRTPFYQK